MRNRLLVSGMLAASVLTAFPWAATADHTPTPSTWTASAAPQGDAETFLACVNTENECKQLAQHHGYANYRVREDHQRCHPKPYACYGE